MQLSQIISGSLVMASFAVAGIPPACILSAIGAQGSSASDFKALCGQQLALVQGNITANCPSSQAVSAWEHFRTVCQQQAQIEVPPLSGAATTTSGHGSSSTTTPAAHTTSHFPTSNTATSDMATSNVATSYVATSTANGTVTKTSSGYASGTPGAGQNPIPGAGDNYDGGHNVPDNSTSPGYNSGNSTGSFGPGYGGHQGNGTRPGGHFGSSPGGNSTQGGYYSGNGTDFNGNHGENNSTDSVGNGTNSDGPVEPPVHNSPGAGDAEGGEGADGQKPKSPHHTNAAAGAVSPSVEFLVTGLFSVAMGVTFLL